MTSEEKCAYITLATDDNYCRGVLVLANSLRKVGTKHKLVALITDGISTALRDKLHKTFDLVKEVNVLDSNDEDNLLLIKRPELGVTFTKLHCWKLTQFTKCVFLDADTLVIQNCDELFDKEELSAVPDVGWPDCFNSGVFVFKPSEDTYASLLKFASETGSFDGGDQGLLNMFFCDWATKDISKHLSFIYNMNTSTSDTYLLASKQFGKNVKIVHFLGNQKPWMYSYNKTSEKVEPSDGDNQSYEHLKLWWDLYVKVVVPEEYVNVGKKTTKVSKHLKANPKRKWEDEYMPTAEQLAVFDKKTAEQFHSTRAKAFQLAKYLSPPSPTHLISPNSHACKRFKDSHVMSEEGKMAQMVKEMKRYPFHAHSVKNTNLQRSENLENVKKPSTKPKNIHFQTTQRAAEANSDVKVEEKLSLFHAKPVPTAVLNGTTQAKAIKPFKAQAIPPSAPFQIKHKTKCTVMKPFSFEFRDKDRIMRKGLLEQKEKENRIYVFRARPMPSAAPSALPVVQKKPITLPKPFYFRRKISRHSIKFTPKMKVQSVQKL